MHLKIAKRTYCKQEVWFSISTVYYFVKLHAELKIGVEILTNIWSNIQRGLWPDLTIYFQCLQIFSFSRLGNSVLYIPMAKYKTLNSIPNSGMILLIIWSKSPSIISYFLLLLMSLGRFSNTENIHIFKWALLLFIPLTLST